MTGLFIKAAPNANFAEEVLAKIAALVDEKYIKNEVHNERVDGLLNANNALLLENRRLNGVAQEAKDALNEHLNTPNRNELTLLCLQDACEHYGVDKPITLAQIAEWLFAYSQGYANPDLEQQVAFLGDAFVGFKMGQARAKMDPSSEG